MTRVDLVVLVARAIVCTIEPAGETSFESYAAAYRRNPRQLGRRGSGDDPLGADLGAVEHAVSAVSLLIGASVVDHLTKIAVERGSRVSGAAWRRLTGRGRDDIPSVPLTPVQLESVYREVVAQCGLQGLSDEDAAHAADAVISVVARSPGQQTS